MPKDSPQLRQVLIACLPSLVIDSALKESGQRVVYLAHFEDSRIPSNMAISATDQDATPLLKGWEAWGQVVVKVVADADPITLARLQAETAILSEVRPTSFPKLYFCDLFSQDPVTDEKLQERLYVSIEEFIHSKPLSDISGEYKSDEGRIAHLALGIATGLNDLWMHQRKFVHRDIKPENLLVRPSGEVVLIDLGIVRETGAAGVTNDGWGRAPFTPGYAAPEQIANEKEAVTFKTDFFSIGVVMYRLLSGQEPFIHRPNMQLHEVVMAAAAHHPPALVEYGASEHFSVFVEKAMEKEPWARHRTPAIFIEELRALLNS